MPIFTKSALVSSWIALLSASIIAGFATRTMCCDLCPTKPPFGRLLYIRRRVLLRATAVLNIFWGATAAIFVPVVTGSERMRKREEWVTLPFSITVLSSSAESLCERGNILYSHATASFGTTTSKSLATRGRLHAYTKSMCSCSLSFLGGVCE